MKNIFMLSIVMLIFLSGCYEKTPSTDNIMQKKMEQILEEGNKQVGMPAIVNYQEKKNLKWIYELCDQEDFICHAYLFNSLTGEIGQYLGPCIGYGIPYSTQFSNPEKSVRSPRSTGYRYNIPQAEPNGVFKPEGLSATWLIMFDPITGEPSPAYIEPEIMVFPFIVGE